MKGESTIKSPIAKELPVLKLTQEESSLTSQPLRSALKEDKDQPRLDLRS